MNKKVNLCFSIIGIATEIYYFLNAFNIWSHHIGIGLSNIADSIPKILVVIVGLILTIVSMIFHKENYKPVNIINYISIGLLVISTGLLII